MQKKRPNVILFLADDMGFSDIGCYGSEIETGNLDALAHDGLRYTECYTVARCCPSRAALLTGLYPHQAGVGFMVDPWPWKEYQGYLNDSSTTIAQVMKDAGYRTAMTGKWHVGGNYWNHDKREIVGTKGYPTPLQRGFERFWGTLEGAGDYYNPITLMDNGKWISPKKEDDFYYTEQIAEHTKEYINEFRDEPFFVYCAFNAPHWPLHAREEFIRKYEKKYLKGWDELRRERREKQVREGIIHEEWELTPRDPKVPAWESIEDKDFEDIKMAVYAAQVEEMDRAIGSVVDELKRLGLYDDTLILFTSDNGACAEDLPDHGWIENCGNPTTLDGKPVVYGNRTHMRPGTEETFMSYGRPWANLSNTPFHLYKHWIHEGGISSPLIAHWPNGITEPGRIIEKPFHFIDILPTLLDLAEGEYPSDGKITPYQGESIRASFTGEWERQKPIFFEHEGNRGVREGKWKLVSKHPEGWELYDMERDRTENHNVIGENRERADRMIRMYEEWAERTGVLPWDEVQKGLGR